MKLFQFISIASILLFGTLEITLAQSYPSWGKLTPGEYKIGFRTIKTYDSSRTYKPDEGIKFRPLLIHLWYPTRAVSDDPLTYKSYIALEAQRENFSNNNVDEYCNQTIYGYIDFGKKLMGNLNVTIDEVLSSQTASLDNPATANGKFPLILYAPSFGKSSIQNNIACEYLASHGYIIASVASAGESSQVMTSDGKGIMAQVQDLEYVVNYLKNASYVDGSAIGTFGYSWGGFANIIHQMRNTYVKAIASWDGSMEYQGYEIAKTLKDFNPEKLKIPFIYFSNKNEEMTEFPFYKSVVSEKKYLYRLKQLEHPEFTSYWTVFSTVKANASPYSLASYKSVCEYTLAFFDTYLKGKKSLEKNLENVNSDAMLKLTTH